MLENNDFREVQQANQDNLNNCLRPSSIEGLSVKIPILRQPLQPFSTREIQVLSAFAQGKKRKQIAEELQIKHGTINSYIQEAYNRIRAVPYNRVMLQNRPISRSSVRILLKDIEDSKQDLG